MPPWRSAAGRPRRDGKFSATQAPPPEANVLPRLVVGAEPNSQRDNDGGSQRHIEHAPCEPAPLLWPWPVPHGRKRKPDDAGEPCRFTVGRCDNHNECQEDALLGKCQTNEQRHEQYVEKVACVFPWMAEGGPGVGETYKRRRRQRAQPAA